MNALNQYIELYDASRHDIDSHSAEVLNALRPEAADILRTATLPRQGADNYENCDLEQMLAPDFGIDLNDLFPIPANMPPMPEGVLLGSLRTIAQSHPELVARYYGHAADIHNPVVALNTMLVRDGLMLYVPKGVELKSPIQLINVLNDVQPLMSIRRILVVLDEGAEAGLMVCDRTQRDNVDYLALQTVELFVGPNATLHFYDLEESSAHTGRISSLYLRQERASRVTVNGHTLFNGTTRNEYHCRFLGENASLKLYGMAIEDCQRHISTYSRIEHGVPRCHSDELFKISADGESRCAFTGRIVVEEGAVGTEAYQACRNLLASDQARVEARPELEIYNDDVKCSHGCATGQLDETQLFYMRTRGIPESQARLLLRQAFMNDVIDAIEMPGLRDRLRLLVEKRFACAQAPCSSCALADSNNPSNKKCQ